MTKWIGPLLSLLLIIVAISTSGFLSSSGKSTDSGDEGRIVPAQLQKKVEKKEAPDSHFIQVLKELKQTVDGWLKSLNERIEREDVTRFEVRFLEILRSVLEWIKEKIDSKLRSSGEEVPGRKGSASQQTFLRIFHCGEKG